MENANEEQGGSAAMHEGMNEERVGRMFEERHTDRRPYFQGIILERELCEVYLLMDHLSGRWDKRLIAGDGLQEAPGSYSQVETEDAASGATRTHAGSSDNSLRSSIEWKWIERICAIGWSYKAKSTAELATQAAELILAKDHFNAAAKPATGMIIAFTLMATGHVPADKKSVKPYSEERRLEAPMYPLASRTSLARTAFPGLVAVAGQFRWKIRAIVFGLLLVLITTCFLSWDMTSGYAILGRLDAIEVQMKGAMQKIIDAERLAFVQQGQDAVPNYIQATTAARQEPLLRLCDRSGKLLPVLLHDGRRLQQFNSLEEIHLCESLEELRIQRENSRSNLADWMHWWRWLNPDVTTGNLSRAQSGAFERQGILVRSEHPSDEEWARIFVPLLLNSVLPFLYGMLGAGASVMRHLRMKTKESLLSPRDITLAVNQLVLGATIGACIGLFVAQSQSGATGTSVNALIGVAGLTGSGLSFLAGFGVEGVFTALESLVKRVFNLPDQAHKV